MRHKGILLRLEPAERYVWVVLLELAAESPAPGKLYASPCFVLDESDIARQANVPKRQVHCALEKLIQAGWVKRQEDGAFAIAHWSRFAPPPKRPNISLMDRTAILNRDGYRCRYCGVEVVDGQNAEIDHVIPLSRGGESTLDNLVTSCAACNRRKHDKTPEEARMTLLPPCRGPSERCEE